MESINLIQFKKQNSFKKAKFNKDKKKKTKNDEIAKKIE
jgi:hypothetical protein